MRLSYREAMRAALREALATDPRVFLMGEDVGRYGGAYAVSKGLLEEFGPERVRDTPLSESVFVGAGIGAALGGMRPIVEVMTVNFSLLALDQVVNTAATLRHMSGGQLGVPLVVRMATGAGRQVAAQHSHSLEGWYAHIPGIRVLAPATPHDARWMLPAALREPDPVFIFEHTMLYPEEGEVGEEPGPLPLFRAAIRRPGRDVTVIAHGGSVGKALAAAEQLAGEGVEAEVIDLRSLRPLDDATLLESVRRCHRAVVVDEGWRTGSLAAEISARITEGAFFDLDQPVARVCSAEVPIPYPKHLEDAALPQPDRIVAAVRGLLQHAGTASSGMNPMGEFRMPLLGADMVTGTLTEWYKHPGDSVHRGDIIAAVDTDKGSIDIEVFEDGVLEQVVVPEGQKVPVGTLLAMIRTDGEPAPAPAAPAAAALPPAPAAPAPPAAPAAAPAPAPTIKEGARVRASPLARRLAAERGVDLSTIHGTGEGGTILREDIVTAAGAGHPPDRMRRAIAAAMARSKREIPHFYLTTTIDFGNAAAWLEDWNTARQPAERLLPAVLLLKATALALKEFPEFNARWEQDRVQPAECIHIGVATSVRGGGLVVPALHHVNQKTLPELMADLRDLVQRARAGSLRSSDLTDGTITVTSLGDRGADMVLGVIYPPQTAIVGFGSVVERPWVSGGAVVPRQVVTASLSADHRASDGHRGAAFLATIDRMLQTPEAL